MRNFLKDIFRPARKTTQRIATVSPDINYESAPFDEVIVSLSKLDLKLNTSASDQQISDAQHVLNFVFPEDFVYFYNRINGFSENDVTNELFGIWPIERIIEEFDSTEQRDFIAFGDYMINSHSFGYSRSNPGIFKSYDLTQSVANSFEQTLRLMLIDSSNLY